MPSSFLSYYAHMEVLLLFLAFCPDGPENSECSHSHFYTGNTYDLYPRRALSLPYHLVLRMIYTWEFPGAPVVRTWRFHCCGPGSIPGWGTNIPQAAQSGQKFFEIKTKIKKIKYIFKKRAKKHLCVYVHRCVYKFVEPMSFDLSILP